MKTVYDEYEARNWFRAHGSLNVSCVKDGMRAECHTFPEAERFFLGWNENDPKSIS